MIHVLAIMTVIFGILSFVAYKLWSAQRTIDQVLKVNSELEQTNRTQAAEIKTQQAEIKNAKIQRKHNESVKRSSAGDVDQQLQQHGWFRDEDDNHGLRGVQPDLPEPCRHGGDETPSTGPQSDVSGDLQ